MKIYTYGIDQLTINFIKQEGYEVIAQKLLPEAGQMLTNIFLFSDINETTDLEELHRSHPDAELIYWHQKKGVRGYQSIYLMCQEQGIYFLPPRSTIGSVLEKIRFICNEENDISNNIIGFFGSGPGIGCTSIAKIVAQNIASMGKKVILLGLNLYDPGFDQKASISLDQLRPRLTGKFLSEDIVEELIKQEGGYYYLPGNQDYLSAQDYQEEEIEYLIDYVSKNADVVLCDFGTIPESAAWYVGMQKSGIRLFVTHPKHNYRLSDFMELAEHFDLYPQDFKLIINRNTVQSVVTAKSMSQNMGSSILFEIPQYDGLPDRLPIGKKEIQMVGDKMKLILVALGLMDPVKKGWL